MQTCIASHHACIFILQDRRQDQEHALTIDTTRMESNYIRFTALQGSKSESALCYLLEIDEAKILLDCGWNDAFDVEDLKQLKRY